MELEVPPTLKAEHQELRAELDRAASLGGMLGDAAKSVERVLFPHLEKEEEYVLPPLSLLPLLTEGEVTVEMGASLAMTNRLRTELPNLIEDHRAINTELEKLAQAAEAEQRWEYACYAEKFRSIAQYEEKVLFPAVMLIARYVRLNLDE